MGSRHRRRNHGHAALRLHLRHRCERRHLDASRQDQRVDARDVQLRVDIDQREGITRAYREIVLDLERDEVFHRDVLALDVVDDELGEWADVRSDHDDPFRPHQLQAVDQRPRRRDHRRWRSVLHRPPMQPTLRDPVVALAHRHDRDQAGVAEHVHPSVGELDRAAVRVPVHRFELVLRHALHPHARGMERETLRKDGFARAQHRRYLALHRHVGTGNDLADTERLVVRHGPPLEIR